MPLPEKRRKQLDGIVSQMEANQEPVENIQFVVNDFKQKYGNYDSEFKEKMRLKAEGLAAGRAQAQAEAERETFDQQPWYNKLLSGMGKTFASTPGVQQIAEFATGQDIGPEEFEAYQKASEGSGLARTGEVISDVAMFAVPGSKIAKFGKGMKGLQGMNKARQAMNIGFMEGAGSGLMHQAQNLGQGKDLSLGEFGLETVGSGLIPGGFVGAGQGLKKFAPKVLRSAVKPTLSQMDAVNPPDFNIPLQKGLIPVTGGLEEAQKLANRRLDELGGMRGIDASYASMFGPTVPFKGVRNTMGGPARIPTGFSGSKNIPTQQSYTQTGMIDLPISPQGKIPTGATGAKTIIPQKPEGGSVVSSVMGKLKSEMGSPKGKLTQKSFDEAKDALEYWEKQGLSRSTMARGKMTVEDAIAFRQVIDDQVQSFKKQQKLSDGFDKVSKMMRRELNDYIREQAPRVGALTDEMAEIVPFRDALERRAAQEGNNLRFGLMDAAAGGLGGTLGMASSFGGGKDGQPDNPLMRTLGGMALLAGGRRLTSTPGGARLLYDLGRNLERPGPLRATGMQTLRSLYGTQE